MKARRVLSMAPHKVLLGGRRSGHRRWKIHRTRSNSWGNKSDPNQGDAAMKSSAPGYQSTNDVAGLNRKSSGNAASSGAVNRPRKTPNCTLDARQEDRRGAPSGLFTGSLFSCRCRARITVARLTPV